MSRRIEIIDALRGFASLAVCWGHLTHLFPEGSVTRASGHSGWLGVYIFFVISGFVIPYSLFRVNYKLMKHWQTFMAKRILRIEPSYILTAIISILLWYFFPSWRPYPYRTPDLSFSQALYHLGYLTAIMGHVWVNPVFWTLAIEFQFYILMSFFFPMIVANSKFYRFFAIAFLCFASVAIPSKDLVPKYLCLFGMGIVTFQYRNSLCSFREYIIGIVAVGLCAYFVVGPRPAAAGFLTALIIGFIRMDIVSGLTYLGAISYSLYLIHVPIGVRIINRMQGFASNESQYLALSLFGLFISIISAHTLYKYVEKPTRIWSSRLKYRG